MEDLTQSLQIGGSSTTTPAVAPPTVRPPVISPGERDYLRLQARHILLRGGSEQDVVNFARVHAGRPAQMRAQMVGIGAPQEPEDPLAQPATEDNFISGISLNALQGITFGFGDEAM